MIKAVIFDCDGTIYDNKGVGDTGNIKGIERTFQELKIKAKLPEKKDILKRCGMPNPDFFVGLIPDKYFKSAYPLAYKYTLEEITKLVMAKKGELFNGTVKTLKALKNKSLKLGLVTNCEKDYIRALIDTYSLDRFFDLIMSVEEINGDKGDLIKIGLKKLGIKPKEALVVGDRKSDCDAAKKAGCKSVAVTYGYGSAQELKEADYKINNLNELSEIIKK